MYKDNLKDIAIQDSISILENTDLDINTIYDVDLRTYQYAVNLILNEYKELKRENQEKDDKVNKILERLRKDVYNISNVKNDGNHRDDYSINRLKAYRTKTREIAEYIDKVYFEIGGNNNDGGTESR